MTTLLLDGPKAAPLPHDEQIRLARLAKAGDTGARDRLVQSCFRFVARLAHRKVGRRTTSGRESHFDDLFSVGASALVHALTKFDPDHGVTFLTYAVNWVRVAFDRYLRANEPVLRVPPRYVDTAQKMRRLRAQLGGAGLDPAAIEVQVRAAFGDHALDAERAICAKPLRMDAGVSDVGPSGANYHDWFPELATQATVEEEIDLRRRAQRIRWAVYEASADFTDRERAILEGRLYLVGDRDEVTLQGIAATLGVSRERIRQIEMRMRRQIGAVLEDAVPEDRAERIPLRHRNSPRARRFGNAPPRRGPRPMPAVTVEAAPVRRPSVAANGLRIGDVLPPMTKSKQEITYLWPSQRVSTREGAAVSSKGALPPPALGDDATAPSRGDPRSVGDVAARASRGASQRAEGPPPAAASPPARESRKRATRAA